METKERGWGEKEATHHLSLPKPLSTFQMEGCVVSLMGGVDHRGPQLHVPLRWRERLFPILQSKCILYPPSSSRLLFRFMYLSLTRQVAQVLLAREEKFQRVVVFTKAVSLEEQETHAGNKACGNTQLVT